MSPLTKESDVLTVPAETSAVQSAPAAAREDAPSKPQPVALEVPVTANGARTVPGSDKREPFSETTKTVLVFGTGTVIRLTSQVEPGQLLFLTNEKTKKEVVCQVVKSKNYRSVSGYVELEFTEPAVGFWGMRFPGDRIGSPAPAPAALKPGPSGSVAPATPGSPAPMASQPAPSAPAARKPEPPAPAAEAKTPAPARPADDPNSTQALKLEASRLQEQLSSLLFQSPASAKPRAPEAAADSTAAPAAKVLEFARPAPVAAAPPAAIEQPPAPKTSSPSTMSSMAEEEMKVPSWLEPLARNASPASPPPAANHADASDEIKVPSWFEPLARNASLASASAPAAPQHAVKDAPPVLEQLADSVDPVSSHSKMDEAAAFGNRLLAEDFTAPAPASSGGAKKGLTVAAIAAGILLAAAGATWYLRQPGPGASSRVAASVAAPPSASASGSAAVEPNVRNDAPAASSIPAAAGSIAGSGNSQQSLQPASQVLKIPRDPANAVNTSVPESRSLVAAVEPAKRPALGEIKLAAPKVSRGGSGQGFTEAAPNVLANESGVPGEGLSAGLASTQPNGPAVPASPLPVGGDVRTAQLLSSVRPSYPTLAKSQHISGDVKIDALIDPSGRVTTMKVISGPTLLHQAAMDALKQWKYRAATLNGTPTSTHLTVTIQFRLQ